MSDYFPLLENDEVYLNMLKKKFTREEDINEGVLGTVAKAPFKVGAAVAKAPVKIPVKVAKTSGRMAKAAVKAPFKGVRDVAKAAISRESEEKELLELLEKWAKEVDIKSTGEHSDKSIAQLKKQIVALRGKPGNKEKMGELLFALRAKQGWKKDTGL